MPTCSGSRISFMVSDGPVHTISYVELQIFPMWFVQYFILMVWANLCSVMSHNTPIIWTPHRPIWDDPCSYGPDYDHWMNPYIVWAHTLYRPLCFCQTCTSQKHLSIFYYVKIGVPMGNNRASLSISYIAVGDASSFCSPVCRWKSM